MSEENQLAHRPEPMTWDNMEKLASAAAASGMFGITKKEQAICLFAICQSEGLDPITALKRYHLIQGRPSMRADATLAEFMKSGGGVLWHARTDVLAAATFFADKKKMDGSTQQAIKRFDLLWEIETGDLSEEEEIQKILELAKLGRPDEQTILRTFADAEEKGLTKSREWNDKTRQWDVKDKVNWLQSPRQMLTARVITEGLGIIAPGIKAGIYTPDEIEDIITAERVEQNEFVDRATKQESRDIKAMELMREEYLRQANEDGVSSRRKSELLGLASDLRVKIDEIEREHGKVVEVQVIPPPSRESDDQDEIPGLEKSADNGVVWPDYVLHEVKSASLRGRELGSFTADEIRVIANKFLPKLMGSKKQSELFEGKFILEADKHLNPDIYKEEKSPFQ